ncbi:hypothetical protein MADA3029_1150017 [Vibrio nigripulchritudo MADA3029]|uniref:hypothetical protein n=1 Tax=Vibrio nigripulchritudo TaxID=28173 RepID=UPI0003B1D1E7|nr:hypothetical protein [Vibrio nigripulchritudo]CCN48857.1 hypothetical protein VIBNIMADA3020_630018 [Vibrio nigripulchritudo MADA3020]CCN51449.1 hypothetical protein VIBNIMADA3021_1080019 [Vibrio nigripulchritudo MADA3021]CCN57631.1 hypothetical protein MADA3029_1150017 [Vibrio nigripulchritudo MADA3029]BCL69600.1 hypothetical protein VNTUMSATTG_15370 [Vibrio nigripulchritudo]BDU30944.1 hypothetical protein TUMSATVNIG1_15530 [Vibrio nigripulchritudo]
MGSVLSEKQKNLIAAKRAVEYVKQKMTIGAANKPLNSVLAFVSGSESPTACLTRIRSVNDEAGSNLEWLRAVAKRAESNGCGNCGEQAAIAFCWLLDHGYKPVDYMVRVNADHAFVVIGRLKEGTAGDPKTWGDDAVVCDPWDRSAYSASYIASRMWGGGQVSPNSLCRMEK